MLRYFEHKMLYKQRFKKWRICHSFQSGANFWTMHWYEQEPWALCCQVCDNNTVVKAQIWLDLKHKNPIMLHLLNWIQSERVSEMCSDVTGSKIWIQTHVEKLNRTSTTDFNYKTLCYIFRETLYHKIPWLCRFAQMRPWHLSNEYLICIGRNASPIILRTCPRAPGFNQS